MVTVRQLVQLRQLLDSFSFLPDVLTLFIIGVMAVKTLSEALGVEMKPSEKEVEWGSDAWFDCEAGISINNSDFEEKSLFLLMYDIYAKSKLNIEMTGL